jgi:hypothetical protein
MSHEHAGQPPTLDDAYALPVAMTGRVTALALPALSAAGFNSLYHHGRRQGLHCGSGVDSEALSG